ncbi:MAG: flagellar export chaperone FliS, partial [candidate division Zixibacteria bacterium]
MIEQPEKKMTSLYKEFLEAKTSGKSQRELIVFLYGLAINLMEQAKVTMNKGDMSETSHCLNRARNIFLHLLSTLNLEADGDSEKKLSSLYLFIVEKINIANSTKSVQDLDD